MNLLIQYGLQVFAEDLRSYLTHSLLEELTKDLDFII